MSNKLFELGSIIVPTYIYSLRPTRIEMLSDGPTEDEAKIVTEHFNYLSALTASGQVLMAGRTLVEDERAFGIVIFTAQSEDEAAKLVADDPAVLQGVMSAELLPFEVALWSDKDPL